MLAGDVSPCFGCSGGWEGTPVAIAVRAGLELRSDLGRAGYSHDDPALHPVLVHLLHGTERPVEDLRRRPDG